MIEYELLELWDSRRQEIASRLLGRGHDPGIVLELSLEGLAELEDRLSRLEKEEQRRLKTFTLSISQLLRNPAQSKRAHQLPLRCDDLPKDPLRVKEVRKAKLKKECTKLKNQISEMEGQIYNVMCQENSEDRVSMLENSKAEIEKALEQKQEELARLS